MKLLTRRKMFWRETPMQVSVRAQHHTSCELGKRIRKEVQSDHSKEPSTGDKFRTSDKILIHHKPSPVIPSAAREPYRVNNLSGQEWFSGPVYCTVTVTVAVVCPY